MDPGPEAVIDALLQQQARLAGDLVQIDEETWALHATIPLKGDEIVAEVQGAEAARSLLDRWPSQDLPTVD
jgi:hypothetical protein